MSLFKDNSKKIEQKFNLRDGRMIYKTDNGFTCWVVSAKKKTQKVTNEYYTKALKLAL